LRGVEVFERVCPTTYRRTFHDDEAGALQMTHAVFGRVVFSIAPLELQGEGDGVGEVAWIGGVSFSASDIRGHSGGTRTEQELKA
jgi:hypothetical protein